MGKLTDKGIAGLRKKAARYEKWDGDGLGVRVTPRAIKTFVLVYHFDGRPRRLTLGRYRAAADVAAGVAADGVRFLTLTQARRAAQDARHKLEQGIDPGTEKKAAKEHSKAEKTVGILAQEYLKLHAKPNKRSWKEDERILNRDVLPRWLNRKAKAITRADVIELLDEIAARGAPIMANRTKALLSKMFRWGLPRGYVEVDPTTMVEKPGKERKRERALTAPEIKKFWSGLEGIEYPEGVKIALRLLLVTAQRRGEVAGVEAREIDEGAALWTIPGSRTKNGRPHGVPLSKLALTLIRQAREAAAKVEDREPSEVRFLFPAWSRKGELRSMRPDLLTRALLKEAKAIVDKPLSPHDLRRTASTLMGAEPLSVPRFIRDKILNHSDRTPGAHYDVNEYVAEKRAALTAWGDHLEKIAGVTRKLRVIEGGA